MCSRRTLGQNHFHGRSQVIRLGRRRLNAGAGRGGRDFENGDHHFRSGLIVAGTLGRVAQQEGQDRETEGNAPGTIGPLCDALRVYFDRAEGVIDWGGLAIRQGLIDDLRHDYFLKS